VRSGPSGAGSELIAQHRGRLQANIDGVNADKRYGLIELEVTRLPPGGLGTAMLKDKAFQVGVPGSTRVAAQNATLTLLAGKLSDNDGTGGLAPAVAVVAERPQNQKLILDIVCSVSGHVTDGARSDWDQMVAAMKTNADQFAKTNTYRAEVIYPDGTSTKVSFGPGQSKRPEFASALLGVEVDLSKVPPGGKVIVRGGADGSGGASGQLHLRTVELFVP